MPKDKKDQELQKELGELKDLLKRVQADFENYRKRSQKEKEEFGKYLNHDIILRLLPILDNFQMAMIHLPKELEGDEWVHGVWHIEKQLEQVLTEEGVQEIKTVGEPFDPNKMEAVEEVQSKEAEGTVVEEVFKGYEIDDRLLRPAKVKVAKGSGEDTLRETPHESEC